VLQNIRLLAFFTKAPSFFKAVGLMHATLQGFGFESNFPEHGSGDFCVDWFAAMRGTGKRNLLVSEAEAVSRSGSNQRNCLMGLCRRAQIGNGFGRTQAGGNGA